MVLGRRIASLNSRELVVLSGVFLRYPLYLLPTYKATRKTVAMCDHLYKDLHHEDNRTNAFRHALWNYLICQYCLPISKSPEKTMSWSKKITDLHERLSPNDELAKNMDFHNNRIGRELFYNSFGKKLEIIPVLQHMTAEAVKVQSLAEIEEVKEKLIFIDKLETPL